MCILIIGATSPQDKGRTESKPEIFVALEFDQKTCAFGSDAAEKHHRQPTFRHCTAATESRPVTCDIHFKLVLILGHHFLLMSVVIRKLDISNFYADKNDEKSLLDDIVAKLPPKESWDAELFLGVLVLG